VRSAQKAHFLRGSSTVRVSFSQHFGILNRAQHHLSSPSTPPQEDQGHVAPQTSPIASETLCASRKLEEGSADSMDICQQRAWSLLLNNDETSCGASFQVLGREAETSRRSSLSPAPFYDFCSLLLVSRLPHCTLLRRRGGSTTGARRAQLRFSRRRATLPDPIARISHPPHRPRMFDRLHASRLDSRLCHARRQPPKERYEAVGLPCCEEGEREVSAGASWRNGTGQAAI
jgi:hypothetical protein